MAGIAVIATLTVADGQNEAFETAFTEAAQAVAANEPGNSAYRVTRSRENGQVYKILEVYADQAALEAHGASDHFKALGRSLKGVLAGAPTLEYLDLIA